MINNDIATQAPQDSALQGQNMLFKTVLSVNAQKARAVIQDANRLTQSATQMKGWASQYWRAAQMLRRDGGSPLDIPARLVESQRIFVREHLNVPDNMADMAALLKMSPEERAQFYKRLQSNLEQYQAQVGEREGTLRHFVDSVAHVEDPADVQRQVNLSKEYLEDVYATVEKEITDPRELEKLKDVRAYTDEVALAFKDLAKLEPAESVVAQLPVQRLDAAMWQEFKHIEETNLLLKKPSERTFEDYEEFAGQQ